jgi:hypothetical protein
MLRTIARVFVVLVASALTAAIGLYVLLVVGSRRGVQYYYGR